MKKSTVWTEIGDRIDAACRASDKSMNQIATDAGVHEETLRLWRKGLRFPTQENWEGLAKALRISVRDLLTLPANQEAQSQRKRA